MDRCPIKMTRIPVVQGQVADSGLSWEEVYTKYVNLIKLLAKDKFQSFQMTGSYQSAEDLFQEGQIILYNCWSKYRDRSLDEFGMIFKASLRHGLNKFGLNEQKAPMTIDIDDEFDLGYDEEVTESLYFNFKLQQVAVMLKDSPVARQILQEFIKPSENTLWEAKMDIARKEMIKSQGVRTCVPRTVDIKPLYVQRSLGLKTKQFHEEYTKLKSAIKAVYDLEKRSA